MPESGTNIYPGLLSAPAEARSYIDPDECSALTTSSEPLEGMKSLLANIDLRLKHDFAAGEPVEGLLNNRAWAVEQLVLGAWQSCIANQDGLALIAVGGFGRGVLHPHSDVDLLILFEQAELTAGQRSGIENFVSLLWDAGIYLGHSVRNLEQCVLEADTDVVTATSLMEARLLSGKTELFERMTRDQAPEYIWSARDFFHAKYAEQKTRHQQFHETAYNLEPNIKESPGGLRDIQMIGWVTQRHFGARTLHSLVEHGFLTETEHEELTSGQQFLWKVRFALHQLAGRAEDRLLFEYQRSIALQLGYTDETGPNSAVERFMQDYYRTVTALERLNERLLQLFEEELLADGQRHEEKLGDHFRLINGYLDVQDEQLFQNRPVALMEMFLLLARHPDIRGVRASAIRLVVDHLHLVDEEFRRDPEVLEAFCQLMSQDQGVYTQLIRMNRYGVLAAFLPVFANIVGRMQFDLFHVYTVDQHILFVIRNLRRFAYGKYRDQFPHAPQIFKLINRPCVLYLAALFHDIAKGREGDHSELGATDALEFCAGLPLAEGEAELIAWLVENHLLMSLTAQKKDISDPEVIEEFADKVQSIKRLQHLYLLTVADISATSPTLWNGWKSGILWELYQGTEQVLKRGKTDAPQPAERLATARKALLYQAVEDGVAEQAVNDLIASLPDNVMQRFTTGQLLWGLASRSLRQDGTPVIAVRDRRDRAVSELFVSAQDYTGLFATLTAVLDGLGINVLSARVVTGTDGRTFDLFQVVDRQGLPLNRNDRESLESRLVELMAAGAVQAPHERRMPRRLRPFVTAPALQFSTARRGSVTSMVLESTDRPGLLSQVAAAMVHCGVRIHDAMIVTLGDRVEDVFLVSDDLDSPLDIPAQEQLHRAIMDRLDP